MGARYLLDLADVCRRTGYTVIEVDDWQYRARGSGGYNDGKPDHVMCHHTGSPPSSDGWGDVNYCTFGDEDAPLANIVLSRVPEIYICAGGATNTNGTGDCPHLSPDTMNSRRSGSKPATTAATPGPTSNRTPTSPCATSCATPTTSRTPTSNRTRSGHRRGRWTRPASRRGRPAPAPGTWTPSAPTSTPTTEETS